MKDLRLALEQLEQKGLYRRRKILQSPQGREIILNGQRLVNFSSNDYLGLAADHRVKQAFIEAANTWGVGSGSAHLVNGHSQAHHALEEELADFIGAPRALLFSTGYMANLGIAQSLCDKHDNLIEDKLNHASLLDAARLSGARLSRYLHCDYSSLSRQLQNASGSEILVSSDSVFSMDGDEADISALRQQCQQHKAWLQLDDAHGFGVLGKHGRGSLSQQQITADDSTIYMATLGKALGTAGAFVAASDDLIEYLIQTARSYIYTTAMPAAIAQASRISLRLLVTENWRQQTLLNNINHFKTLASQAGLKMLDSSTAIQPVIIGDSQMALQISQHLFENGFHVAAIRPPTVPRNTARLRITLSVYHTEQDIEQLITAITTACLTIKTNEP